MPLVTNTVPNMIGGVAQTPETIRHPNQCEVQENAVSSIVDGLSKRPPTKHVKRLLEHDGVMWPLHITGPDNHAWHTINRDTGERYFVSIDNDGGTGRLRVHDTSGEAVVVYGDTDSYLSITSGLKADENFDFLTVADITFITNKTTPVAFSADLSPHSRKDQGLTSDPWPSTGGSSEALLWVTKSDYKKTYKVHVNGVLAALHETPDGLNPDIATGSAEFKFLEYGADLDGEIITLRALGPDGFIHTRTYEFDDDAATTETGKFVDTDLNFKGTFDISKIRSGDISEPSAPSIDDMYEIVESATTEGSITWDLNSATSDGFTTWDTDEDPGTTPMNITAGDMIKWNGTRWVLVTTDARVKVGIQGMATRAGAVAEFADAITSNNGHSGLLSVQIKDEDALLAESQQSGHELVTKNIIVVSQTKQGHEGNTVITTDVDAADIVSPAAFTGGSVADGVGDSPENLIASTESVAAALSEQLEDLTGHTTMQSGSVIYIHKSDNTDLNITVEEGGGGDDLRVIKRSVQQFSKLPPIAPEGFIIEVEGAVEEDLDNYYVKFQTDGTEASANYLGTGKYIETIRPSIKYKLDPASMPHVLIRQSDGTFYFKPADKTTPGDGDADGLADVGNTAGVPDGADYTKYGWHDRLVGDETTNLDPSFLGFKINALTLYKGRLVFLSDENVIFSESAVFWNFFKVKTTVLLDTDRVDISPSGEKVSILRNMLIYNDQLIVSSDQTQFAIKGNPMITPTSVSATPVSDFEILKNSSPIRLATSLFYPFKRGDFAGLRELFVTNGMDLAFGTQDLTEAVPAYIPGNITQLVGSTHEGVMCVISDDADSLNKVFVYNYDQREGKTILASWSTFVFDCDRIHYMSFIDSTLYLIVERTSTAPYPPPLQHFFLETIELSSGLKDSGSEYVTNLDRRVLMVGADEPTNVTYDATTNRTTIILPYVHDPLFDGSGTTYENVSNHVVVVSANQDSPAAPAGYVYTVTDRTFGTGPTTSHYDRIEVVGDLTNSTFFIGTPYTMKYQFTEITMKRRNANSESVEHIMGRHQLRYGEVSFADSGYFKVQVTPTNKTSSVYTYTGKQLGTSTARLGGSEPIASGTFRFPVFSKSAEVKIELINDSPFPSKFISTSFEALFQPRANTRRRF